MSNIDPNADIPKDGPGAVLARVAQKHGLSLPSALITRAVATHPRPTSLLALVDVGKQIGLEMTPVKSTEAGIATQETPMIAHFTDPGGAGGFGVVEGVDDDGFEMWDSAHGEHTVPREPFLAHWSGVLVLVQSTGEQGPSRKRAEGRSFWDRSEAPSLLRGGVAPGLRTALSVMLLALLVLFVTSLPAQDRFGWGLVASLSVAGLAVTALMSAAIADYQGPFAPGICRRGRFVDCQSVLTSRFATVAGFPLSDIGIAFYSAVLLLLAGGGGAEARAVIGAAFLIGVAGALVLIGVQVSLRRVCTLCLAVHGINVAAGILAVGNRPGDLQAADTVAAAALFSLFFALVLLVGVPYVKQGRSLSRISASYSRMSASPFASLAQLLTEEPTQLDAGEVGIEVGGAQATNELIAFVHPTCSQCGPVIRELLKVIQARDVRVLVTFPPRDPEERDLCSAMVAVGLARGPEMMLRAFATAKEAFDELLLSDAHAGLATRLSIEAAELEPFRERARAMVATAESFADEHVEGTPAIFFNSLPYKGPMGHLITLLQEHPDLLPGASSAAREPS